MSLFWSVCGGESLIQFCPQPIKKLPLTWKDSEVSFYGCVDIFKFSTIVVRTFWPVLVTTGACLRVGFKVKVRIRCK